MDKDLWYLLHDLRRYGQIIRDESKEDATGAWRNTTYLYNGIKFFVSMHNGEILSIS